MWYLRSLRRAVGPVACLLVVCLVAGTSVPPEPARVDRLSFTARSDGQGYVVRFHTSEPVSAYREPLHLGGDQVEVILFNTRLADTYREAPPAGPVREYHIERRADHLVVRFRLADAAGVEVTAYRDRATPDLLVGLAYPAAGPTERAPAGPHAGAAASADAATASAAHGGVEAPETAGQRWRLDTIVIDAGHGGRDPGATAFGVQEKDVTLAVARRLGRLIERDLGVRVVYTRDDDRFVELRDRGRRANQMEGKLFLSIHVNAAANAAARGTETYFLGMHKTEAAQHVMERENSVVNLESDPEQYRAFDDGAILQTLAQSAYMRKSEALAALVEERLARRTGRTSRGVKQAGFYVLWSASMPAVLVELGFVTNRAEAEFMASERGQADLAGAIFEAVRVFKEDYERGLDYVAR